MNIQIIFNCLPGHWTFTRTLQSKCSDFPSGIVKGKATFVSIAEYTLHYKETGEFTTTQQETFKIHKEYLYRYNKDTNTIEKHFIENNGSRLFYELAFSQTTPVAKSFSATGEHLCALDNYKAYYEFPSDSFDSFRLIYLVKGPHKDYTTETLYINEQPSILITSN